MIRIGTKGILQARGRGQRPAGTSSGPNDSRTISRSGNSDRNSNSGFIALLERLQNLSFLPFQMSVLLWLGEKGFGSIRPLGRIHRRGRRARGGADFLAKMPGSDVDVAIQIRHWRTPLQRRAVDELWGFMLRRGVPLGLIVTSSGIMKSAELAISEYPGRPIQLVSCRQLCSSMAALELGLRKAHTKWILDESFFTTASRLAFASAISVAAPPSISSKLFDGIGRRDRNSDELGQPDHKPPSLSLLMLILAAIVIVALLMLNLGFLR